MMKKIAVLITVYNRIDKTVKCLTTLFDSIRTYTDLSLDVYITDDGSSDGTSNILGGTFPFPNLHILQGNGQLYWNGGMINSWKSALGVGGYDGYLWLNNDVELFSCLWNELLEADKYSIEKFGQSGVYIGSTCDSNRLHLTYGGFNFTNKWTLKDSFVIPNGTFQSCQCGHGNITYVAHDVVSKIGILCDKYWHGGGDHDYTFMAYKKGIPQFILREYVGICENDHHYDVLMNVGLKERIKYLYSPLGFNLHNTLLFQKRCFPYRYPFVLICGYMKAIWPKGYSKLYQLLRK
ncbi:MAG: glycosyltransferase [Bacteroides sp.]|nr:glycosyltransferase [Roseburia sp.]MCM1346014.1 glycosyltransferase [Bacteroides sp.]MCM1421480.1 glycosyltransferase [Bacteroides sp.]